MEANLPDKLKIGIRRVVLIKKASWIDDTITGSDGEQYIVLNDWGKPHDSLSVFYKKFPIDALVVLETCDSTLFRLGKSFAWRKVDISE